MLAFPNRLFVVGSLVVATACSKTEQPPAPAPTPPPAASPNVVTVTATDYAFEAPDTIPSGPTTLRLVNQGKELHHIVVMKASLAMLQKMNPEVSPPPGLVVPGGPNGGVPGLAVEGTLDLEPGEYTIVCLIPTAENVPHFMKGMMRPLVVTAAASAAPVSAATPDITVQLTDYSFAFSTPLTAGKHVIRVENTATQLHEMLIVKMAPGKTAKDMDEWARNPKGPPPGMPVTSASPLSNGRSLTFTVDLPPGEYGLLCFVPDAKDGKFHTAHGMIQDIKL